MRLNILSFNFYLISLILLFIVNTKEVRANQVNATEEVVNKNNSNNSNNLSYVDDIYYFDFKVNKLLISKYDIVKVEIIHKIDTDYLNNYFVIPIVSNGVVEVSTGKEFVESNAPIYKMPTLSYSQNILLKFRGFEGKKLSLYFQIYDISRNKFYETPKRNIWMTRGYSNYLINLNENIKDTKDINTNINTDEDNITLSVKGVSGINDSFFKNYLDRFLMRKYLLIFLPISIILGFCLCNDKIRK